MARRPVLLLPLIAAGCGGSPADAPLPEATVARAATEPPPRPWFVDVAPEAGLRFLHATGAGGSYYFPEIAASGCALFDYDGDGDLDAYAVQAYALPGPPPDDGTTGRNRLYRNELAESGRLRFTDVTDASGLGDPGYGMGAAVGDYDNDGDLDVYVTNFGPNRLYRNNGDGTFTDVSGSIPPEDRWSTSAAFVDYDRDGLLDLFVANYVNFTVAENKPCHSPSGRRDYCGPQSFDPVPDRLFRNRGDGTFTDVTAAAGIDRAFGSGLGVVCDDFDGDGWTDIYVANDGNANQLWMNLGNGTFEDRALLAGAAYNAEGKAEAGMGVTAGDFDLDGDDDIFLSHLDKEHNTLLVNDGHGYFDDRTNEFELAAMSWPYTGFGTEWADLDGDGLLDLFVADGAVKAVEQQLGQPYPYGNPNLVIRNEGPPLFHFRDVSAAAGPVVNLVEASRGAAFGDVDNDGDPDILVSTSNGPLRLLRNDAGNGRPWLVLRLRGTTGPPSAVGAVVEVQRAGRTLRRRVHADGSYASAGDLRVAVALEPGAPPASAVVTWPGGTRERFGGLAPGPVHELVEGTGEAVP